MNNRQKAKHFKKLYEQCLYYKRIQFPVTTKQIITVRAKQTVHESVINNTLSAELEPPYVIAGKVLMQDLSKELMKHSKIKVIPSIIPDHVDIEASIDIAK